MTPLHPAHLTSKSNAELAQMCADLEATEDRYLRLSQWYGEMVIQVWQEKSRRLHGDAQAAPEAPKQAARSGSDQ